MPLYLCETCGTQYAETSTPPEHCPVCEDDRQYVGWNGQRWTTHEALAKKYTLRIEEDAGLLGLSLPADFASPQRAGGEKFSGRYFQSGTWARLSGESYGPQRLPAQRRFLDFQVRFGQTFPRRG